MGLPPPDINLLRQHAYMDTKNYEYIRPISESFQYKLEPAVSVQSTNWLFMLAVGCCGLLIVLVASQVIQRRRRRVYRVPKDISAVEALTPNLTTADNPFADCSATNTPPGLVFDPSSPEIASSPVSMPQMNPFYPIQMEKSLKAV